MNRTARTVLEGLIDYAGLFPPAALQMAEAVRNYAAYRRRPDAWALGRFVVPVGRLGEWEEAIAQLPPHEGLEAPWPLAGLIGGRVREDVAGVTAFRARHHTSGGPEVCALEARVIRPADVELIRTLVPTEMELYLEPPLEGAWRELIETIHRVGAYAKIRTGGVEAGDFPPSEAILGFLEAAAGHRLPFKATAGLHHPVRRLAPLTYEPDSASALMFGYLNVVLAASVLWAGRPVPEARRLLTAQNRATLAIGEDVLCWEGIAVSGVEIGRARREFLRSVGSCSFIEPVEEIASI